LAGLIPWVQIVLKEEEGWEYKRGSREGWPIEPERVEGFWRP